MRKISKLFLLMLICAVISNTVTAQIQLCSSCVKFVFTAPDTVCKNRPVTFTNISSNCTALTSFRWDFGDGSAPVNNAVTTTHTYTAPGTYTAKLSIISPFIPGLVCPDKSFTRQIIVFDCDPCPCKRFNFLMPDTACINKPVIFENISLPCTAGSEYSLDFGDGSALVNNPVSTQHIYTVPGVYNVRLTVSSPTCPGKTITKPITIFECDPPPPCINCIGSFAPEQGEYIISAWVKEENALPTTLTYTNPQIYIQFPDNQGLGTFSSPSLGPFTPTGAIIDGWQRIEWGFIIPSNATYINLQLKSVTGNCFFDDIRVFPVNGSMKSYVYDPVNLRLVAELDERNYATMYEYDEEGKLIRVKKETEKGVMTIKENKNSTKKKP